MTSLLRSLASRFKSSSPSLPASPLETAVVVNERLIERVGETSPLLSVTVSGSNGSPVSSDGEGEQQLVSWEGLSSSEAASSRALHGSNELPDRRRSPLSQLLRHLFLDVVSILVWAGCVITILARDWIDLGVLLALQTLNAALTFHETRKSDLALRALSAQLALTTRLRRDGVWSEQPAHVLVPGDVVRLTIGCVVPADCIVNGTLRVDTSSLTGESLPKAVFAGGHVFSGTVCLAGDCVAVVTATGLKTVLGKQAKLIGDASPRGPFQILLRRISYGLLIGAVVLVAAIVAMQIARGARSLAQLLELANYAVALLISAIPVGMAAVCTTTMAVGASRLAKHGVIISKLPVLLDLASLTTLCADKTGTLTTNKLALTDPYLHEGVTLEELLLIGALAGDFTGNHRDAIDETICSAVSADLLGEYEQNEFVPFDPVSKRTESVVTNRTTGMSIKCVKGAPQVLFDLADFKFGTRERVMQEVEALATRGLRSVGVCTIIDGIGRFLGIVSLHDPLRYDTLDTVAALSRLGVGIKMVSGDHQAICRETCRQLGLNSEVLGVQYFEHVALKTRADVLAEVRAAAGFSEVLPEQKHFIVNTLQSEEVVGMTGDGVNDAAALKQSDCGIAVHGASDAARGASDLVFSRPGIGPIVVCIVRARKIFERLRNYILFRIAISISVLSASFVLLLAHEFSLPPLALVVLVISLDITVLASSKDKVFPSVKPSQWRVGEMLVLACVIGILGCLEACAAFWLGSSSSLFFSDGLSDDELAALVYLALSLGSQLSIFVCRTRSLFFSRRPGWSLVITVALGLLTAVIISVFAVFEGFKGAIVKDCAAVLIICIVFFLVKDIVKVMILQAFKFREKSHDKHKRFFEENRRLLQDLSGNER